MTNPLNGVYLNDRYYNFENSSYRRSINIKNSVKISQRNRVAQVNGIDLPSHAITLHLENKYNIFDLQTNNMSSGTTEWSGVSRLADLVGFLGALGNSQPLVFIAPDGTTHLTIATGALDISIWRPEASELLNGREYRVNLTLENVD